MVVRAGPYRGGAPGAFAPGATARGRKIGKIEDSIGLIILILISEAGHRGPVV